MSDRLLDIVCYVMIVGLLQGLVLIAIIVLFLPLGFIERTIGFYKQLVVRASLLNIFLLVFGCIGNSAWMLLTYDRLYVSADTAVDYFPFFPFGQWVLDVSFGNFRGHLIGLGTVFNLQLIWISISCFVWSATMAAYLKSTSYLRLATQQFTAADVAPRRR